MDIKELVYEVFYREERGLAELRLSPPDAEQLVQRYHARCVPMENGACPDGKTWYRVWIPAPGG